MSTTPTIIKTPIKDQVPSENALEKLKDSIEGLSPVQQVEIHKILQNHEVTSFSKTSSNFIYDITNLSMQVYNELLQFVQAITTAKKEEIQRMSKENKVKKALRNKRGELVPSQ